VVGWRDLWRVVLDDYGIPEKVQRVELREFVVIRL